MVAIESPRLDGLRENSGTEKLSQVKVGPEKAVAGIAIGAVSVTAWLIPGWKGKVVERD